MAKRRCSDASAGTRFAKRCKQQEQHLYVLVDDWERGYSARKIALDSSDAEYSVTKPPERFTEPPVGRLEAQHGRSWSFVAHGTKIFAMQPPESSPAIPALDVHTLGTTVCPWPSSRGCHGRPLLASVGGSHFFFLATTTDYLAGHDLPRRDSKVPWSWNTVREPQLPFAITLVTSYEAHPDGRPLFVSAEKRPYGAPDSRRGTFSFDTHSHRWTRHGDWLLPFEGRACFDRDLEAWVGLCRHRLVDAGAGAGYLCSCDVVAPPTSSSSTNASSPPPWKLAKDKLYDANLQSLHLGATLVYMGGHSKFSLVESRMHAKDQDRIHPNPRDHRPPTRRRVLRVTTFGLEFDEGGELRIVAPRLCANKRFKQTHYVGDPSLDPVAFWI